MLNKYLAQMFRSCNTQLLYVKTLPVEKFLKVIFLFSAKLYHSWISKARPPKNVLLTNIDHDIKMNVDISKVLGAAFYWTGFHELNEWRFLHKFLTEQMVFVDIGANQGEYTLFAAKRLKKGRVIAFEPVNDLYQKLHQNILLNDFKNITSFKFGLSDTDARLPIYMGPLGSRENEGFGTLYQSEIRNRFIENVELKVFDSVIDPLALERIDFMKIDVEGAELAVLKGSIVAIMRYRPHILLEINEDMYQLAGYGLTDILTFFKSLDYSMYKITKSGTLIPTESVQRFSNVVFVPK